MIVAALSPIKLPRGLSPHELHAAAHWVTHLRECVAMGVSAEVLLEKNRIARLFISSLTLVSS